MRNYPLEMSRNLFKAVDLLDKLFQQTFVIITVMREVRQLLLDQVSRIETITDPKIYEKFYDSLSKAIFLETEKI